MIGEPGALLGCEADVEQRDRQIDADLAQR
jgi:hypothetical protein